MTKSALAAALAVGGFFAVAAGAQASIIGIDGAGKVYAINTANAQATLVADFSSLNVPPAGTSGDAANSPNALAYDGTNFYFTSFGVDPTNFYRGNTVAYGQVAGNLTGPGGNFEVAAGDIYNGTYYYVNRDGSFYSLANAATNASASNATQIRPANSSLNLTYGDIAISSTGAAYVSGGTIGLATLNLGNGARGSEIANQDSPSVGRWAGLAFDSVTGALYGVNGGGGVNSALYLLDVTGVNAATLVGNITLGTASLQLTDAATGPVPIPAALPMLMAAVAGLGFAGWRSNRRAA